MSSILEDKVLTLAKQSKSTVEGITSKLEAEHPKQEVMETVRSLERKGRLELREVLPSSHNFLKYLIDRDYSLWFHLLLLSVIAINLIAYTQIQAQPLPILRIVLGLLLVLYLPGYSLVEALFPERRHLEPHEKIALSVGLSMAVTILIGLVLNYSPFGIRLQTVLNSLSVFTLAVAFLAVVRKFRKAFRDAELTQVVHHP